MVTPEHDIQISYLMKKNLWRMTNGPSQRERKRMKKVMDDGYSIERNWVRSKEWE